MPERRRRTIALLALLLGAGLLGVLVTLLQPADVWGAMLLRDRAPEDDLIYRRVQTVTLHSPSPDDVYATSYGTRFQISIQGYTLGQWIRLPQDVVTNTASCQGYQGDCQVVWGEKLIYDQPTPVVTFAGSGHGDIYLDYETWERATRSPDSREVILEYPVGPFSEEKFSLTNTIIFNREADLRTAWQEVEAGPSDYDYDAQECVSHYTTTACSMRWQFTETSRLDFSANFVEPLLGSDLVVEHIEVSTTTPPLDSPVIQYTVTVRNVGAYTTGRAVIAGVFVRPNWQGPPELSDTLDQEDALVDWIEPGVPPESWSYWWVGLGPGERVTGTTMMTLSTQCPALGTAQSECGVWGYVDCLANQSGFIWRGHNAEGLICDLDEDTMEPTCIEEQNNVRGLYQWIYLPLVLKGNA